MVMLNAICDCLRQTGVDFIRIDGTTKNDDRTVSDRVDLNSLEKQTHFQRNNKRMVNGVNNIKFLQEYVKRFQEKESCLAAVLSIKACNSGITLTAAQLVIFAELDWNPSVSVTKLCINNNTKVNCDIGTKFQILAQAESRAHRIGQEGTVVCRYLMAKGTADDVIWEMLKSKEKTLIKAGIFSETLSDAKNVASSSKVSSCFRFRMTLSTTRIYHDRTFSRTMEHWDHNRV